MYVMSRVPRPRRTTRRPVANGSSVPAWPTRLMPVARRTCDTTSCDVMPAGLSTSRRPPSSVVGVAGAGRVAIFELSEQGFDSRRARETVVHVERDLRREPQPQRATDARPEVGGGAR